jgi:hypothetical protein
MRFGKISLAVLAAAFMASAPVAAQLAQNSSATVERADAKRSKKESKQDGGSSVGLIVGVLTAGAIIGGLAIANDNADDAPTSP